MAKSLLITYLLTYGGAAASLLDPFAGLLVYVCFSIIKPESLWFWSVPIGNYSKIVGIALLVGWVIHGFGDWRLGRARSVVLCLVGFLVWSAVGYVFAPDKNAARVFVEAVAKIVLPFLVGITTINSVRKLKLLAWVIVVSQGYVAFELYLTYRGGYNRLQDQGFGFMDNNSYAIGLVAATGLAFFLGLGDSNLPRRLVAWTSALFCANAVFLAFSRGAMLALLITGMLAFLLIPKQPKHYLALGLAIVVALRLAGPQVQERFATIFSNSEKADSEGGGRLQLWKACVSVMIKSPVLGVGPDHWPLVAHQYGFTKGKSAHSLWLEVGADLGVPGLGMLAGFYLLCIARLRALLNPRTYVFDPWIREAARMVISALIGFMIAGQFVSLFGLEMPYFICLIGAGALKLNSQAEESSPPATTVAWGTT
ncbi:MAG: O-antigen ligase family protein [Isosphaeraceae bacterium]